MSNTTPNRTGMGTTPSRAIIRLDREEEEEEEEVEEEDDLHPFRDLDSSDSEGGMQLDLPEQPYPIASGDTIPYEAGVWEDTGDEQDTFFSTVAPNPTDHAAFSRGRPSEDQDPGRVVARPRHRLREEEHAALAVLDDEELLVMYAVKNGLTIPQTRRRFTAKLLAPENPVLEEELYGARFVIPASRSELLPSFLGGGHASGSGSGGGGRSPELATGTGNATAYLVPGSWKEILTEEEDGWWGVGRGPRRKGGRERGGSGNGRSAGSGSRVGSVERV